MNTRPIRFFHRGVTVEISNSPPTRTVLEWLREDARCSGTKEGCAEGDCGACTVVIGELAVGNAPGGGELPRLLLKPVNACIQFLPTLDGRALFTVEDLTPRGAPLHPVQQAMVDCHGSQCGFCTPGFVMSLWASYERHAAAGSSGAAAAAVPSRQQLADDLSGNLCRCTGYRPILDAGQRMFTLPLQPLARQPVTEALQRLAADPPLQQEGRFHAPRDLAAFAALRADKPEARIVAGSTDIGLWVTKQFKPLGEMLYIGNVAELQRVDVGADTIVIGAAATLEAAWQPLVAAYPALRDVWLRFASLPIRMAGTMVGNVANGSPIGDCAPVLIALGAVAVLRRGEHLRRVPLEDFHVGYMRNRLEPGEFVQALEVPRLPPLPDAGNGSGAGGERTPRPQVRVYKISKRFDCDISAVCSAASITLDGDRIGAVRLAWGGMAATVRRSEAAEAALLGRVWDEAAVAAAQAALSQDFQPLSDLRASSGYRLQVAQNLLRRLWLETRPVAPLPESAVNVWAREEQA